MRSWGGGGGSVTVGAKCSKGREAINIVFPAVSDG